MRIGARALIEPTAIWAFPDGELVVGDAVNGGILRRFGASGAEISAIPLPGVPLDVVGTAERIYVLLGAADAWQATPERTVLALTRDGSLLDGYAAAPRSASTALVGLLARGHLALAPLGGFALADMYLYSRIRLFSPTDGHLHGGLLPGAQEIPVLYKAEGFAPLGRRPAVHRDASLTRASIDRLAHPCADLVWDPRSRLFWFLGGNVDRTPDGRWIRGREVYRYDAEGRYRGSLVLPFVAVALAAGGDGSLWAIDSAGGLRRWRIRSGTAENPGDSALLSAEAPDRLAVLVAL